MHHETSEEGGEGTQAVRSLLGLSLNERLDTVAADLQRDAPRYRGIASHTLAEALGVPQPDQPCGDGWVFTRYTLRVSLEKHALTDLPPSEYVYKIRSQVTPERFAELVEQSSTLDDSEAPSFHFLLDDERVALEAAIAEEMLDRHTMDGICCVAHYTVVSPSGVRLTFEAQIEDDGSCFILKTPYDEREGRFLDLAGYVTREEL